MRCQAYRWAVSAATDSGRDLPGWARRHEADCADCRAHRQQVESIVHQLGAAYESETWPGSGLHQCIMNAVHRPDPTPDSAKPPAVGWLPALAATAAMAVIAVVIFTAVERPRPVETPFAQHAVPRIELAPAGLDPGEWLAVPYERELGRLTDDLASGGAFLADCLGWDSVVR